MLASACSSCLPMLSFRAHVTTLDCGTMRCAFFAEARCSSSLLRSGETCREASGVLPAAASVALREQCSVPSMRTNAARATARLAAARVAVRLASWRRLHVVETTKANLMRVSPRRVSSTALVACAAFLTHVVALLLCARDGTQVSGPHGCSQSCSGRAVIAMSPRD